MLAKSYQSTSLFPPQDPLSGQSDYAFCQEKPRKRIIISRKYIKSFSLPKDGPLAQEKEKNTKFSLCIYKAIKVKTEPQAPSNVQKFISPYWVSAKQKKSNNCYIPSPNKNTKQLFKNKTIQVHMQYDDLSTYIEQKIQKLKAYYTDKSEAKLTKLKKNHSRKLNHIVNPLSKTLDQ